MESVNPAFRYQPRTINNQLASAGEKVSAGRSALRVPHSAFECWMLVVGCSFLRPPPPPCPFIALAEENSMFDGSKFKVRRFGAGSSFLRLAGASLLPVRQPRRSLGQGCPRHPHAGKRALRLRPYLPLSTKDSQPSTSQRSAFDCLTVDFSSPASRRRIRVPNRPSLSLPRLPVFRYEVAARRR
jgi:hypothetical protein